MFASFHSKYMHKLLLVDDHSIIRTGLQLIIKSFLPESKIDEAEDGNSAFDKLKNNEYDLVIMDVSMPNTDTLDLVSKILKLKLNLKILMFSMNNEGIYAKRFLRLGAKGYLKKDASSDELKKAIKAVLNDEEYLSPDLSPVLLNDFYSKSISKNPFDRLSPREFEIFQHLIRGESIVKISEKLKLHSSTVGTHKARALDKLKCKNLIELSELAKDFGLGGST